MNKAAEWGELAETLAVRRNLESALRAGEVMPQDAQEKINQLKRRESELWAIVRPDL